MRSLNRTFSSALVGAPPSTALSASVIVPAKDEAALIPRVLSALSNQVDQGGERLSPARFEVILLVNNSTDDSLAVARDFKACHPLFPLHVEYVDFPESNAYIGEVRRTLMDEACRRLESSGNELRVILSTDADTEVASNWIFRNLQEIRRGAEAVGGLIEFEANYLQTWSARTRKMYELDAQYKSLSAKLEHCLDPQTHDPWPHHYHHFGASLAVTTEAYRRVGGLPPKRSLEDLAFYESLMRYDVKLRHSPEVQVRTSARLDGKTEIGLAEQLRYWDNETHEGADSPVDSFSFLKLFFETRRSFRQIWSAYNYEYSLEQDKIRDFAIQTGLSTSQIKSAVRERYFGLAWEELGMKSRLRSLLKESSKQAVGEAVAVMQAYLKQPTHGCQEISRTDQPGSVLA